MLHCICSNASKSETSALIFANACRVRKQLNYKYLTYFGLQQLYFPFMTIENLPLSPQLIITQFEMSEIILTDREIKIKKKNIKRREDQIKNKWPTIGILI